MPWTPYLRRAPQAADPCIGSILADRYCLVDRLGKGGMGSVFLAKDQKSGRSVAVKHMHPDVACDSASVERFWREAQAAGLLHHPNCVAVLDVGRTAENVPFLVMEYLPGKDVRDLLGEGNPVPVQRACAIVTGVLALLAEAHAHGILHRDLKPENVRLTTAGDGSELVKVLDFGLARVEGEGPRLTSPGTLAGTPGYMSPEQIKDEPLDARSDLYVVGLLLYELLTGHPPFSSGPIGRVATAHVFDKPADPRERVSGERITEALSAVTLRALAKRPADRFQTAAEMRLALEAAAADAARREAEMAAIDARLAVLDAAEWRMLEAIVVLGDDAPYAAAASVSGQSMRIFESLLDAGLVEIPDSCARVDVRTDPRVQKRVAARLSPADLRELHDRALAWYTERDADRSRRAEHAYHGSAPLAGLWLAKGIGDDALERGAHCEAIRWFGWGLAGARAQHAETANETFEAAMVHFSRKLAEALRRAGRDPEVLALRQSLPTSPESVRPQVDSDPESADSEPPTARHVPAPSKSGPVLRVCTIAWATRSTPVPVSA